MAFIPSEAAIHAEGFCDLLLAIETETVLRAALSAMSFDIGPRLSACNKSIDGFPVTPHIPVIQVTQQMQRRFVPMPDGWLYLNLHVFGARSAQVPIQL